MNPCQQLDDILPRLSGLVASLDESDLDAPTPCSDFAVRDVLAHMIGGASMFSAAFRGQSAEATPPSADLVAAFPGAMTELRAAVGSPGALERTISAPFGEVPGEAFARFVALDGLVHGWDIATALNRAYEPPSEVVAAVGAFARQAISEQMRDGTTFAAAVDPGPGSSPLIQLVAFTGRQP